MALYNFIYLLVLCFIISSCGAKKPDKETIVLKEKELIVERNFDYLNQAYPELDIGPWLLFHRTETSFENSDLYYNNHLKLQFQYYAPPSTGCPILEYVRVSGSGIDHIIPFKVIELPERYDIGIFNKELNDLLKYYSIAHERQIKLRDMFYIIDGITGDYGYDRVTAYDTLRIRNNYNYYLKEFIEAYDSIPPNIEQDLNNILSQVSEVYEDWYYQLFDNKKMFYNLHDHKVLLKVTFYEDSINAQIVNQEYWDRYCL